MPTGAPDTGLTCARFLIFSGFWPCFGLIFISCDPFLPFGVGMINILYNGILEIFNSNFNRIYS